MSDSSSTTSTIPAGFGVSGTGQNYISRSKSYSVQTADKLDSNGKIIQQVTHGGAMETTEEYYCDNVDNFTNPATDGQSGETVITNATVTESQADFAKVSLTKRTVLGYPETSGSGSGN